MFDAVLFDMDGLLLDSERVLMRAWTSAAALEGCVISEETYASVIGRSAQESHAMFVEMLGGAAVHARLRDRVQADLRRGSDPGQVLFPLKEGVVELLTALRARGVPLAVASSSSADEIRHRLEVTGVLGHFDAVAGGNEVTLSKPDPAVYGLAAERLGLNAGACLAFEDSENGARAALAAGAALVIVPDVHRPPHDVLSRCLHVFESLHDAHEHLPRWFPAAG
jgi:beta-phosphoglucomutase-like phosphatase (HAD superfamily)